MDNIELYWGVLDYISCASDIEKIRERAEHKYMELNVQEKNGMMYFLEDCYNELNKKQVWDVFCDIEGEPITGEKYNDYLAGLLANGRCFFESVSTEPENIRQYCILDLRRAGNAVRAVFENDGHIVLSKI